MGNKKVESSILNNLGLIYQARGEYQQAQNVFQDSLRINQEIEDRAGEAIILNSLAWLYQSTDEYEKALDSMQKVLKIFKETGERSLKGISFRNIGFLYEQQHEWEKALTYYKQSIDILEDVRTKIGIRDLQESFLGEQIDVYFRTVRLLYQMNRFDEAFAYSERSKARTLLEQQYEVSLGVKEWMNSQLIDEEYRLYSKLSSIEQTLKKKLLDERRQQLIEERNALEYELSVLKQKIRTEISQYAGLKYIEPVTVEQVQQEILKEGDILVEYIQGNEEIYVFIIGKTKFYTHTFNLNKQQLSDTLLKLLHPESNTTFQQLDKRELFRLYQLIFQPLEQKIIAAQEEKELETLIIIPDDVLFYLPFEMLIAKEGETPEYLADRYTISYSPSVSVLKPEILHARQPEQYAQDLLALAPFGEGEKAPTQIAMKATEDLLLSDTLRSGLEDAKPLPYSAGEVQTISKLYPQSVCKIGADATKAFFTEHAKGNRYLHLSTHGYLDNEHAMYSGLLFSDGMLQTYEIFNLDIDAELTVLSACETGLGELKAGEGLVGLTRAFMYAGSPSVLVSLWPVSDPSTAAFMKRFYRNLKRGITKAEALRETKIWMKAKSYHTDEHGNVIKHEDPFYWAPFILVGAWE